MRFTPRPYQEEAIRRGVEFFRSPERYNAIEVLPTGCHAKGYGIMMYDGTIKNIENIKIGDVVMGNDSTPRHVLELHRGQDDMYRITPIKGEPFIVNAGHILHLYKTPEDGHDSSFVEISVSDYINKSKTYKHTHKLHRSICVEYNNIKEIPLPPYFLGLLLGDGSLGVGNNTISITTMRNEVKDYIYNLAGEKSWFVREGHKKNNKATSYFINCFGDTKGHHREKTSLRESLEELGLFGRVSSEKFIPKKYLLASFSDRLHLLAGLLDTDSYYDIKRNIHEYCSKSIQLMYDIQSLCRSLGFYCGVPSTKLVNGVCYYRMVISGDLHLLPNIVGIRKGIERRQKKNLLVTGFSVEHIGKGDYYGFTLDGNNLYLDWQFFVHHNSGKSLVIAEIAHRLDTDILVFQPSKEILQQNYAKMLNYVDEDEVGIYSSSQGAGKKYHQVKRITFATIGSVKQHVEEFKHFKVILIDECHGLGSDNANGMYLTFLGMLDCKVLGFTATPYRLTSETYWEPCATMIRDKDGNKVLDKHGQPRFKGAMRTKNAKLTMLVNEDKPFFSKIIYCIQVKDLLDMGYLAQLRYFEVRPPRWNTQRIFKNTTGTEYSEKSVKWMMEESDLNTHIANLCSRLLRPKNGVPRNGILVFTQFVDDAEYITNELNAREGRYCAAYVSGSTTKQNRERILQEFRDGTIQILLNVNCFSTGLDIPKLDTIVLGRPTLSLALHYQSVGRAIRPYENKDAWIIDTVGNTDRFGEVGNLFIGEGDDGKPETFGWVFNYEQGMVSWTQLTGVYLGKSDKS